MGKSSSVARYAPLVSGALPSSNSTNQEIAARAPAGVVGGVARIYADLGSSSFSTAGNVAAATFFPGVVASGKINYNASIFRAGVNYKF